MLEDIEKKTVDFEPNFDDSEYEPAVLPSRLPNLLLNGSDSCKLNAILIGQQVACETEK